MYVVGESHVVACLGAVLECVVVVSLCLQVAVAVQTDVVSHHLYFAHTRDGVGRLVYLVDGIVACAEQREAVVLQAYDVQTLERIQNLRIVDGVFGKAISRHVGATESLRIREVAVAEDASLAVILVEDVLTDAVKSGGRRTATFIEILVLQRYVAIRIDVVSHCLVVVVMLIVIAVEVCALRQCHLLHLLTGDGDVLMVLVVTDDDERVAAEASRRTSRQPLQFFEVFVGGVGFVRIILVSELQHRGVVGKDRRSLGDGISTAIHSFVNVDMHVVPSHRRFLGSDFREVIVLVGLGYFLALAVAVVNGYDVVVCALRHQFVRKQPDVLLDGGRFLRAVVVLQMQILLVCTVEHVSAADVVVRVDMIVCGIAHLHLSGTEHVARIRTSRNGTEDMAVKDVHVGHADDVTLLTAAVYEVG